MYETMPLWIGLYKVSASSNALITLSLAAKKAGISVWDFLARMSEIPLELHYDVRELEEDLRAFEGTAKSQ